MEQKTNRIYPSAPSENKPSEQRLEKKLNDESSFNNSIINIKEVITHFKEENNKSEKKCEKYKTLTTKLKSFDTFVFIATTSSSSTLSLTGIGLTTMPIPTASATGLSIGNRVVHEVIM